jgi:hypothetical protein
MRRLGRGDPFVKARPLGTRPAARFEPLEGRLLFAAGDVDLAFGGGDGVATGAPPDWVGRAMAVAADGSIVAAGSPPPTADGFPGEGFALVRYTPGGAIDPTAPAAPPAAPSPSTTAA